MHSDFGVLRSRGIRDSIGWRGSYLRGGPVSSIMTTSPFRMDARAWRMISLYSSQLSKIASSIVRASSWSTDS